MSGSLARDKVSVEPIELRDPEAAAQFLIAGLLAQRVERVTPASLRDGLEWVLAVLAEGEAIPPAGVLADLGNLAFGAPSGLAGRVAADSLLPASLIRRYEDDVLGRLITDRGFDRAAAALRRSTGRERSRGLAYLWSQLAHRAGFAGILVNPAVVKGLLARSPDQWMQTVSLPLEEAAQQQFIALYEALCRGFRELGDLLGPDDLFELEHGTATAAFGQRLALRQVVQAAAFLEAAIPVQPPRFAARAREVAAPIPEEDVYPVGGFASISTRGSIESLLHSQLAWMEQGERPDLFDVKFVRDELLYYSRDENLFLRPRRTIAFVFDPSLVEARQKDPEQRWQRIILACGLVVAVLRRLTAWLSDESLTFDLVFPGNASTSPLADEQEVFELLLHEEIALGRVRVTRCPPAEMREHPGSQAGRATCVALSTWQHEQTESDTVQVLLGEATPRLVPGEEDDSHRSWESAAIVLCHRLATGPGSIRAIR